MTEIIIVKAALGNNEQRFSVEIDHSDGPALTATDHQLVEFVKNRQPYLIEGEKWTVESRQFFDKSKLSQAA